MLEPWVLVTIALLGLAAGTLGGMLGVGGSTIMIPALVILFGQGAELPGLAGTFDGLNQHLYQAAAMIVNVFIAAPATVRHYQAGAIVPRVLRYMLPAAILAILLGVWVSNLDLFAAGGAGGSDHASGPVLLGRLLALFLVYIIVINIRRLLRRPAPPDLPLVLTHVTRPRGGLVGGLMGFVAGLLGIGGGAIAVPLQQVVLKLRLRNCIANSAAVMCISAGIGAVYKNATLAQHGLAWTDSLLIAALLIPTAIAGGLLGGRLTHLLPIRAVRAVFILVLIAAAWKMAAL